MSDKSLYSADEIAIADLAANTPNLTLAQRKVVLTVGVGVDGRLRPDALEHTKSFVKSCLAGNAAQVARASAPGPESLRAHAPPWVTPPPAPKPAPTPPTKPLTLAEVKNRTAKLEADFAQFKAEQEAKQGITPETRAEAERLGYLERVFGVKASAVNYDPTTDIQRLGAR